LTITFKLKWAIRGSQRLGHNECDPSGI
jgi:hypothetical protein